MKFAFALIGATAAVSLKKDQPTRVNEYNDFGLPIQAQAHNNKDILENFADDYNVQTKHQGQGYELLGLDGWQWNQAPIPNPETNYCTNANKATGEDQACSDPGNSAWNTHTSAITKNPENAQADPYPGHTLH